MCNKNLDCDGGGCARSTSQTHLSMKFYMRYGVQLQILLISGFMYFTAFMEPDNVEAFNRREKRTPEASKLEQPATLLDELSEDHDSVASESNKRRKRAAPYMIYPEILVIVDYDGYRLHGGDNLQVNKIILMLVLVMFIRVMDVIAQVLVLK